jgi:capsular polysaccharide biosynthesis protein
MEAAHLVPAFGRDGIEMQALARRPLRGRVGRKPFPVLDLRTRPEAAYEAAAKALPFPHHVRYLAAQYASDLALKEDPLLRAEAVTMFRGSVWHRGEPIQGSVHPKHESELELWAGKVRSLTARGRLPRYPGTSATIAAPGARNYFHWMIEVSPRLFALREYLRQGLGPLDRILLFYEEPAGFITQTIELLFPDLAPRIEYCTHSMCLLEECLFFIDQRRYEDHNSRMKTTTAFLSEAVDGLLARLPRGPGGGRAILISRADAPTRQIVNEAVLLEAFADLGLERVAFSELPLRRQMEVMAEARLVIGAHGAGLTNTIFCRPGTAVVEINTTQYIRRCRSFADIAMHRGLAYGLAIIDQHGDRPVVERNIGNDMEIAPAALPGLRDLLLRLAAEAKVAA